MSLIDIWKNDRQQVLAKRVGQLIAFAGDGQLKDNGETSKEFRELLSVAPSDLIGSWLNECLETKFQDFGFVLQDIVNEIGTRLGFDVKPGVYRGHTNEGYDGCWSLIDRALLVEVKSSTNFSISLKRISDYRKQLENSLTLMADSVSILIVVGQEQTEDFEAQVRGSKFAWEVRLLGARALFKLLQLKESLEDQVVEKQIQDILFPQEFTRLDRIIDLVFATAEDIQEPDIIEEIEHDISSISRSVIPANFHSLVLDRLQGHFKSDFVKQSRVLWLTSDRNNLISCQVSKKYSDRNMNYWFGLKQTTQRPLKEHENSYCAFGLGSQDNILVIPYDFIAKYLDGFFTSPKPDGSVLHWHIRFVDSPTGVNMLVDRDRVPIDVTRYKI